ncbi:Retrovirus-related Pol polyprotein from transposon TNT 1-94 [Vitis vinifera]|uniref:Retrovirus-related Pol polyprotein from transposon TNT 1-94 n=1 Tax=Vitis vinifera TaxID=29760 RepID=A0A438GF40_VITVI|nr:Retrovirus-related Pol polyprotein from transposon TNT 1-94 [Vitis vinifera]
MHMASQIPAPPWHCSYHVWNLWPCLAHTMFGILDKLHFRSRESKKRQHEGEDQLKFPPNYRTGIELMKLVFKLMLIILGLGYEEIQKIKHMKEKHVWSVQILKKMLESTRIYGYDAGGRSGPSTSTSGEGHALMEDFTEFPPVETNEKAKDADDKHEPGLDRSETPILTAARTGIKEIVELILKHFPVAIHDMNSQKKNIVLALHLAANYDPSLNPWTLPGAALQMQWEIKWYEYVKSSVGPDFLMLYNNDGKTAKEIFTTTHKDLVKEGGKWLLKTSDSCSVVAALIATVAFATSATIPGSTEQGKPVLGKELAFQVFAISSLVSLCFSVTSLVMFLAILTSRYQENEFRITLHTRLLWGLSFLLISIAAGLVSFCAGHFFILNDHLKSVAVPIYAVTCIPATLFALAHLPLYFDLLRAIFTKVPLVLYNGSHKLAHLPTRSLVPEPWLTKDLDSGKTIGNAEECSGLYILKERHDPQEQPQMTVAAYLINRMPSRVLKFQTPCQTLLKSFPTTRLISTVPPKIFGCSVFVHINQQHRSKLDPRSLKCIFLGYSSNQKGYKCYSPVTRKFYNSMDATFFETQPYYPKNDIQGENSTQEYQFWDLESFSESPITTENHIPPESFNQPESIVDLWDKEHIHEETEERALSQQTHEAEPGPNPSKLPGNNAPDGTVDSELENDILNMPIAWRKGVRSCTQHPIGNFISYDKLSPMFRAFTSSITEIQVPQNIQEAFKYPKWKAAVDEEVRALEKNGTWEITDLPRGKKPVGCKWIFTVKYKANGNVDRYKARLVAKGFTQSYGIDYQETFAPVAKLNTVRVLLSLAANLDWSLHQLDVKNAFLNGDLEEEVYMDIPAGLETTSNFNKVCRLRKSLYSLKQSPRAWFERFTKVVKGYGFVQCQSDHTLFMKHFPEGKLAIIIVYVDDIILTGDHEEKIDLLKKLLTKEFEIKDLGNLKYFLGMEIARSKKGIAVSQCKYVLDLLNETGMLGCKSAKTPMDTTVKLEESDGSAPVDKGRYQRLVGKLIYLSHTRPDISFSVSVGLFFQRTTNKEIEIFSDADWAGSVTDRRSTSGYCSFVWGNLVTWRSKKQSMVARSSAEAEFRAMAQGICEGIWLNRLLEELRVPLKHPMVLYCDNQAAISIAKNPVHHDRTKHVEID